jgi:hypothetical protein
MHIVRRDSVSGSLELKIASGDFAACSEDEVRALLPIQAYSQKQLSDVSVRMEEFLRFITTPIKSRLWRPSANLSRVRIQPYGPLDKAARR